MKGIVDSMKEDACMNEPEGREEGEYSISPSGMLMSYSPKVSGRVIAAKGATVDSVGKSTTPGRNAYGT